MFHTDTNVWLINWSASCLTGYTLNILMSFFAECNRLMQYNQVYYHDDDMTAGSPLQSQCMPAIVFFLLQVMLTIDAAISASKGLASALAFTLMSLVS